MLALGGGGMTIGEAVQALHDIGADPAMRHNRDGSEYWLHRCAHPDHHDSWPSATIAEGRDGALLLNCFSCAPADPSSRRRWVAQVLGRLTQQIPKDPPSGGRKHHTGGTGTGAIGVKTAHYDYVTADGTIVARKVRFEEGARKTFLWQRPYGDTGWVDGLRGTPLRELPLYGLHSIAEHPTVYVVEGEKDADRLHSLGLAAVTAAGSNPSDIPDDLSALLGRACIVIADRDTVGIRLAMAWAERITADGGTALLAQPKVATPKADVSDHLDAGHDIGALDFGTITEPPPAPEPQLTAPVDLPPTVADELAADRLLSEMVGDMLRRERAKAILTEIKERANPKPPPDAGTVADILARPETESWRIERLLPAGGRMLFTAQRKTGKTTAVGNMGRSLLDGVPFLGEFHTAPIAGRIAVLNYEVTGATFARWMDDIGIDGHRMYVENLRGCANPLATEQGRDELVARLIAQGAECLIVDPFGRAYTGKDQNDAAQITPWLVALDQVAEQAGCTELILTAHAGWNGERTRGSSALEDWPDVIVTLTKDAETGQRYIRAEGRDVDLDEDRIEYHDLTRTYTLTGDGPKSGAAERRNTERLVAALVDVVSRNPGIGVRGIARVWRESGVEFTNGGETAASRAAVERGLVTIVTGSRGAKEHYLGSTVPTVSGLYPGTVSTVPYRNGDSEGDSQSRKSADTVEAMPMLGVLIECQTCHRPTHPASNPCSECRRSS